MVETEPEISFSNPESVLETPPDPDKSKKLLEPDQHVLNNVDLEQEEIKTSQTKRSESITKESPAPKSSTKKSSRFFSASYFSSGDEAEFSPSMVFSNLASALKKQLVNVTIGIALLIAGYSFDSKLHYVCFPFCEISIALFFFTFPSPCRSHALGKDLSHNDAYCHSQGILSQ